jgi:5'-nucleotidase
VTAFPAGRRVGIVRQWLGTWWVLGLCLVAFGTMAPPRAAHGQAAPTMRILLTNDDGAGEVSARLYPLAQELRRFADVYIIVPNQDRSGSGQFMSLSRHRTLESRLRYVSEAGGDLHHLEIHVVDGFPADCVALGVGGIMRDDPPDLIISGPNGGPNLADAWFNSGTIGAARMAAYLGVPAVAVSGVRDDSPDEVAALSRWIAKLAQSDLVRRLPERTYLTFGVPTVPPSEIRGIRVAKRARLIDTQFLRHLGDTPEHGKPDQVTSVWAVERGEPSGPPPTDSDVALYSQGYIVVTPMRADEYDASFSDVLRASPGLLPPWQPK